MTTLPVQNEMIFDGRDGQAFIIIIILWSQVTNENTGAAHISFGINKIVLL